MTLCGAKFHITWREAVPPLTLNGRAGLKPAVLRFGGVAELRTVICRLLLRWLGVQSADGT
jgi:hypothetical protein